MPTYAYRCTECGHAFDIYQSFTEDSLTVCPECAGKLRKVLSPVGVVFKGSGFYRNDSRGTSTSSESSGSSSTSGSSSGESSKGESSKGETSKPSTPSPSTGSGSTSGGASSSSSGTSGPGKAASS
ncbi:FmdB family transcriptional regulator [Serinibacter arcticus]|uniref:FmdB family transcriptional regulator n=1 Tax=Serinibacter arcticus TaxID=1655435 RepID=A0A2U1ZYB4_9MICO|nr:FmdB family zinc ribbon protein [Serinibacter arcticus]PWD51954.1 FmdB family transcriptional regulator [Serinibacter arcticus]